MKTREIACIHYKAEHNCDLGKEGTSDKQSQTCKSYSDIRDGKHARTDNRRKKQERIMRKEKYDY